MKKIISIISIVILFTVCMSPISAYAADVIEQNGLIENHKSACIASNFKEDYITTVISSDMRKEVISFPDNYAGSYIDGNNQLHILYVSDKKNLTNGLTEKKATYDKVNYSYNYLSKIVDLLTLKILDFSISTVGVNEIKNNVTVSVASEKRDAIISYLKSTLTDFEDDMIEFENDTIIVNSDYGGANIQNGNSEFTLGYNVKNLRTNKYGFVTCAHAVSLGGNVYNNNGTLLGTVANWQYSGTLDAAYIPYNSQSNATYQAKTGGPITSTYSANAITVGLSVRKYGRASGLKTGTVTYTSTTTRNTDTNTVFTDQIQLSIVQSPGDSGGLIVHFYNLPPGQTVPGVDTNTASILLGIATFRASDGSSKAWASKAATINSTFGLTTYTIGLNTNL